MKPLSEVIDALGGLADPSRYIDYQIASLIGWKQIRDGDIAAGAVKNAVVWLHALSAEPARVSKFTFWASQHTTWCSSLNLTGPERIRGGSCSHFADCIVLGCHDNDAHNLECRLNCDSANSL